MLIFTSILADGCLTVGENTTTPSFFALQQPLNDDVIICEFKVVSSFIYENKNDAWSEKNRKVYYGTHNEETPLMITFSGLSTEEPKITGNMGTGSLLKVKTGDNNSIVLSENNAFGDIFIYTIFKKEKIITSSKAYSMYGRPYGQLSMGHCY